MKDWVLRSWKNYRHRFVPMMPVNFKARGKREVTLQKDRVVSEEKVLDVLMKLLSNCHKNVGMLESPQEDRCYIMKKTVGYSVSRAPSQLPGGGVGVILSGSADIGDLIAVYPGTVYRRFEPLFLPSIGNHFILRCLDGVHIDGNDKFLSKMIYRSCVMRDSMGFYHAADMTWLTNNPLVPWNIGQFVNNETRHHPANVVYQEIDLCNSPPELDYLLPNIWYSGTRERHLRMVVLVATRKICSGDEVLSNYVTVVHEQ